jgi:site-specific recombinase XerD
MLINIASYYQQSPKSLSVDQIKKYLHYCKTERGLSVSTINQTISALKILFQDILDRPWGDIRIKRPRNIKYLPDILSREEIFKMIQLTTNLKHKAIIAVLYSSGIRRQELLDLKINDIDSKRMLIRVRYGKGNKSRDALLSENTLKILRIYFSFYHPKQYLFEGYRPGIPYSAESVNKVIGRATQKAGITKNIHAHSLRHTFATHLLEQGTNLKMIQKLLGHSSMHSTNVYLHLAKTDFNNVKNPFDELQNPV